MGTLIIKNIVVVYNIFKYDNSLITIDIINITIFNIVDSKGIIIIMINFFLLLNV